MSCFMKAVRQSTDVMGYAWFEVNHVRPYASVVRCEKCEANWCGIQHGRYVGLVPTQGSCRARRKAARMKSQVSGTARRR